MREHLGAEKRSLALHWKEMGVVKDKRVIRAFNEIPREKFVLKEYLDDAYLDRPLPIPAGQTISQPTTVVSMLDALELKPGNKVLEIGAGSGYNAALMSKIVGAKGKIYSIEYIPELVEFATKNLKSAGITNVRVIHADGSKGHAKEAPYDRIIVTAGAPKIPDAYAKQLKEGGILVIPVGPHGVQSMYKIRKRKGVLEKKNLGEYVFVPLTGEHGY